MFKPSPFTAFLSAPYFNKTIVASKFDLKLAKCNGVNEFELSEGRFIQFFTY